MQRFGARAGADASGWISVIESESEAGFGDGLRRRASGLGSRGEGPSREGSCGQGPETGLKWLSQWRRDPVVFRRDPKIAWDQPGERPMQRPGDCRSSCPTDGGDRGTARRPLDWWPGRNRGSGDRRWRRARCAGPQRSRSIRQVESQRVGDGGLSAWRAVRPPQRGSSGHPTHMPNLSRVACYGVLSSPGVGARPSPGWVPSKPAPPLNRLDASSPHALCCVTRGPSFPDGPVGSPGPSSLLTTSEFTSR